MTTVTKAKQLLKLWKRLVRRSHHRPSNHLKTASSSSRGQMMNSKTSTSVNTNLLGQLLNRVLQSISITTSTTTDINHTNQTVQTATVSVNNGNTSSLIGAGFFDDPEFDTDSDTEDADESAAVATPISLILASCFVVVLFGCLL